MLERCKTKLKLLTFTRVDLEPLSFADEANLNIPFFVVNLEHYHRPKNTPVTERHREISKLTMLHSKSLPNYVVN